MTQVIVVGGGLAGLSACHTVLERGARVVLLDKNGFLGGNSTKATSGINGAGTTTQAKLGILDTPLKFEQDTALSAAKGDPTVPATPLNHVLAYDSGPAVDWLMEKFGLDLSLVGQLGGHSFPRTHRGKERFPGMTITYALMEKLEEICEKTPHLAEIKLKAEVTGLLKDDKGAVTGVVYTQEGKQGEAHGPVIFATGGYGADFSDSGLLAKYRPDLLKFSTTNGDHCTGDAIKIGKEVGASAIELDFVQVHPSGLVDPKEPKAKTKFLAAEALRGAGALILDNEGQRFVDELGRRDHVSGQMLSRNKFPYYLVLNGKASSTIEWHCKHYVGRGLMKRYNSGAEFAKDIGVSTETLDKTFKAYNEASKTGKPDQFGKKFFHNGPFEVSDNVFHVAMIEPVIHYCMGGLEISPASEVLREGTKEVIPGLYAAGEVAGGIHGKNRLGGSSLLDCVVFGRVSGASASRYLTSNVIAALTEGNGPARRLQTISNHLSGNQSAINIQTQGFSTQIQSSPSENALNITVSWGNNNNNNNTTAAPAPAPQQAAAPAPQQAAAPASQAPSGVKLTAEEVSKHNTEDDCWVIVNGKVLDATKFLKDHPGGKKAILLYAGKDATEEFNMLHKPDVVQKYAAYTILGDLEK